MNIIISIITQTFIIFLLFLILFQIYLLSDSLKKEKRLTRFTISKTNEKSESLSDKIILILEKIREKITNILAKSKVLRDYSNHYEKYIDYTKKEEKPMDYIANKFIIAILVVIITIVSDILRIQRISFIQIFISFLVGFFLPDLFLKIYYKKRQEKIEKDLEKAVIIMNNAFKSGRSIMQAIELVSLELDGYIKEEFKKMHIDLTYGLDLEVVFERFFERVSLDEVKYISSSLVILNKTGGNIIKIFSSIEKNFFDQKKLKEELKSLTALSSLVFKILVSLPFLIFFTLTILNRTYFQVLYTTFLGKIILALIIIIYISYILVVKSIMRMKE